MQVKGEKQKNTYAKSPNTRIKKKKKSLKKPGGVCGEPSQLINFKVSQKPSTTKDLCTCFFILQ